MIRVKNNTTCRNTYREIHITMGCLVYTPMEESGYPYLRAKFFTEPQDRLYGGFGGIRYTNQQSEVPPILYSKLSLHANVTNQMHSGYMNMQ